MSVPQSGDIRTGFAPRHRSRASLRVEGDPIAPYDGGGTDPASNEGPTQDNGSGSLIQFLVDLVVLVVVVVFCRLFILAPFVIPSGSMEETLGINDRIFTTNGLTRFLAKPRRGDVVVFTDPANWLADASPDGHNSNYLVKRLIGMPGDTVACKGKGHPVTVNGVALDESSYLRPGAQPSDFPFTATVKAGYVFVMGDNRSNSADSRYHLNDGNEGQVPMGNIKGTAMVTYYPISSWKLLNNRHPVFDAVPDRQPR
ncbi:signal peptidase I [uncultured Bifidobacterium sp.]|uniref:signal peptidase I n=1 Tax=uncultured Bifidobacterium sp. TaxID=165187 RepID=UPI00260178FC|nr:signal peptidase I [uncultured Bifidobacterium sp.]